MRETETANTETIFRIIQSIPSPKAEPSEGWGQIITPLSIDTLGGKLDKNGPKWTFVDENGQLWTRVVLFCPFPSYMFTE